VFERHWIRTRAASRQILRVGAWIGPKTLRLKGKKILGTAAMSPGVDERCRAKKLFGFGTEGRSRM
jgi:hypothetical protein